MRFFGIFEMFVVAWVCVKSFLYTSQKLHKFSIALRIMCAVRTRPMHVRLFENWYSYVLTWKLFGGDNFRERVFPPKPMCKFCLLEIWRLEKVVSSGLRKSLSNFKIKNSKFFKNWGSFAAAVPKLMTKNFENCGISLNFNNFNVQKTLANLNIFPRLQISPCMAHGGRLICSHAGNVNMYAHIKNAADAVVHAQNCHSPHGVGYFPSTKNLHMLSFCWLTCLFFTTTVCAPQHERVYLRFHFKTNVIMNHQAPWAMIPNCCCWWCAHRNAHILFHYNNSIITKYPR